MSNKAASQAFEPTAFSGPPWERARDHMRRPTENRTLERMREEMAVRDLLSRYAYAHDQGDVDQVMQLYADDCVIGHAPSRLSGKSAVRDHYEKLYRTVPHRLHLWSNVIVRLSEDLRAGWITAYFYVILAPSDEPPESRGGLLADRVVKRDGRWQICEHTTTVDVTVRLGG